MNSKQTSAASAPPTGIAMPRQKPWTSYEDPAADQHPANRLPEAERRALIIRSLRGYLVKEGRR